MDTQHSHLWDHRLSWDLHSYTAGNIGDPTCHQGNLRSTVTHTLKQLHRQEHWGPHLPSRQTNTTQSHHTNIETLDDSVGSLNAGVVTLIQPIFTDIHSNNHPPCCTILMWTTVPVFCSPSIHNGTVVRDDRLRKICYIHSHACIITSHQGSTLHVNTVL